LLGRASIFGASLIVRVSRMVGELFRKLDERVAFFLAGFEQIWF
jgi:hypothetical protein